MIANDHMSKWADRYHRLIETMPPCVAIEQIRSERKKVGLHTVALQNTFSFFKVRK